jgi:putative endonuclease
MVGPADLWRRFWNRLVGQSGERAAARYLRARGYRIVRRNWRGRTGEIDLIAISPERQLVFVEVKTRRSGDFGRPDDAVNHDKRRRITRAATEYVTRLKRRGGHTPAIRFDIISIIGDPLHDRDADLRIEHLPGAFDAAGPWSV